MITRSLNQLRQRQQKQTAFFLFFIGALVCAVALGVLLRPVWADSSPHDSIRQKTLPGSKPVAAPRQSGQLDWFNWRQPLGYTKVANAALAPFSAVSLTTLGVPYTQNFDTLPSSGSATWANDSTIPGWFHARTGTGTTIVADAGSGTGGALYSYGSTGNTDRAIGSIGSGNAAAGSFFWGVQLQNNTGSTITSLTVSYTGEQWRNSAAAAQTVAFSYLIGSPNVTGTLAEFQSAGVPVTNLDFVSPVTGGTAGALVGNNAPNRTALTYTITGLNIPNGTQVMLRWSDPDHSGTDHGLAIDDLSVTPNGGGAATPNLTINDVSQVEGNSGTTAFNFTVSLTSAAGAGGVTFDIATANGTATTSDNDYQANSLTTQTIPQGSQTYQFTVLVNGDTATEPDETFTVNVTNVMGATVSDGVGQGTIVNDDVSTIAIHTIQGAGTASPFAGQSVTTRGIVTGIKSGTSGGFFIQEPDASVDADPNTSEGVFVFTGASLPAAAVVGNYVQVAGTVQEFVFSSDPNSPPITEISGTVTASLLSMGNTLPVPHVLTAAETTAPSGTTNPLDSLEEFEGMRVTVPSFTVVAPTDGTIAEAGATVSGNDVFYGVVTGVTRPVREPGVNISDTLPAGSPANVPRFDENPERIRVDSDGQPGTTAVDVVAGTIITNLTGPLDYSFRTYTILPDTTIIPGTQPGATPVPVPNANELTVASFNMERFFDTVDDAGIGDPVLTTTAFNKRLDKASRIIRTIQRYPDVIGVEEMENLTTLQAVAAKINSDAQTIDSLPNPNYVAYLVEGNDVGGIDVGFLVKESRVTKLSVTQFNKTETYVNPNTGTTETLNDRPPLVLRASVGAFTFRVIVNHLRSLNGIDDTTANGTGTEGGRVRAKRKAQAESLANLIQSFQISNPTEPLITLGDMNAFHVNDGYVDVIGTIKGTPAPDDQTVVPGDGAVLVTPSQTNLADTLTASQRYSYSFDGNAQILDHIIVNPSALAVLSRFAYARDDADFPVKNYELANELRLSDHDQPVAYFTLPSANADLAITKTDSPDPVVPGADLTYSITVSNSGPDAATSVQWSDTLPAGTTFQSLSAPGAWSCATPAVNASGTVSCTLASLTNGGSGVFTLVVKVGAGVTDGTSLTNTATVSATTGDSNTNNNSATATTLVNAPPTVLSITRVNASPTNAASVQFSVTFSESVSGVAAGNFTLVPTGAVSGASVGTITGSGAARTVTVNTGTGSGTLGLNLTDSTGIADANGAPLSNLPFTGQVYVIDKDAPDTAITANPPSSSNSASAAFSFNGTDSGGSGVASFECKLDSGAFAACTSPQNYSGLSEGTHTFQVRALDAVGNVDASPATYSWTVDTLAPDTTISANPPSLTNSANASFSFTGNDGAGVGLGSFECKLDAGAFAPCTSPQNYSSLSNGLHTFQVRALDAVGNVDASPASYTWTVDTTAPAVTINQAVGQADPTSNSPINFTVVFSEPVTGFAAGDVSLSGTAGAMMATVTQIAPNDGTTYNVAVTGMSTNGTVVATIAANVAMDAAGNNNTASTSTDNTVTYTVSASPTTTAVASSLNPSFTGQSVTFTATVMAGGNPVPTGTVTFSVDGTPQASNVGLNGSGQATFATSALTEGSHVIQAAYSGATGFAPSSGSTTQTVNTATVINGNTYCNPGGITIPAGTVAPVQAAPYPSRIFVTGFPGVVAKMTLTLNNFSHQAPNDLSFLLVGPNGNKFVFLSGSGGASPVSGADVTFDDAAATALTTLATGSFKPTAASASVTFPAPAPALPTFAAPAGAATFASNFNGIDPNGTWSLFVIDGTSGTTTGSIGQWCLTFTAPCPTITVGPVGGNLSAALGQPFSQAFTQTGGALPVTFSLNGSLPNGLTFSGNTLSGMPTQSGTFNFTVTAQDANGCTGSQMYNLVVTCPAITLSPANLPNGTVGMAYNQTITASGGSGLFTFAVTAGTLPNGLNLSTGGALTGNPTANGISSFTITATGAGGCTGSRVYTVTIGCVGITWTPASLPNAQAGVVYNQTVSATGATSYSIFSGNLPPGLTLNATTGVITGTATVTGVYNFTLLATAPGGCSSTQAYSITVACPTIVVSPTNATLPGGAVGTPYSQAFSATPVANYTFTFSGSLPPGLVFNNATGILSGTPTALGNYSFTITTTGFGACTGSQSYSLTITASCPAITLPALPATGKVRTSYFGSLASTTPSGNYTFTVLSGSLPPGLAINNLFAALMGTPTTAGTYNFTLKATQSTGCTGMRAYTIVISNMLNVVTRLNDFDGDGKSDLGIWRGAAGNWLVKRSTDEQTSSMLWGTELEPYHDVIAPGDYDGDGITDLGVYRRSNGLFYVQGSRTGTVQLQEFVAGNNVPVSGDYDGDGQTDFALWQPATGNWLIKRSSDGELRTIPWGAGYAPYNDIPVQEDFDGDGKTDVAIFRPATGTWFVLRSSDGGITVQAWGGGMDIPVVGDYDGDGKADIAVWRGTTGEWFVLLSADGSYRITLWGASSVGDVPVVGDYDGDGKLDYAVWRAPEGRWYVLNSQDNSVRAQQHGQVGDQPVTGRTKQ